MSKAFVSLPPGHRRLADVEGEKAVKKKFLSYPIAYFHMEFAELRQLHIAREALAARQSGRWTGKAGIYSWGRSIRQAFCMPTLVTMRFVVAAHRDLPPPEGNSGIESCAAVRGKGFPQPVTANPCA